MQPIQLLYQGLRGGGGGGVLITEEDGRTVNGIRRALYVERDSSGMYKQTVC